VFLAKLSKLLCFHRFAGGSLLDITAQHCVRTKLRFYSGRLSVTHIITILFRPIISNSYHLKFHVYELASSMT